VKFFICSELRGDKQCEFVMLPAAIQGVQEMFFQGWPEARCQWEILQIELVEVGLSPCSGVHSAMVVCTVV
jgi:hypothetical protein